jgi:hypothetical protein
MSVKHINNVKSLKDYFNSVISETLRSKLQTQAITEEEVQDMMSGGDEGDEDEDDLLLKKGNVKVDDIIEKLNSIRSGRSFRDEKIQTTMQRYISSLKEAEQVALLAFLKAISQIVTAEIPAEEVIDPSDYPANIWMKRKSNGKTITIKPTIVRSEKKDSAPEEDTSGPTPIKPKK